MQIYILQPGDETRLEAFLKPRVDASLFLLSNSRRSGLVDHGRPFEGTYYAAITGGDIASGDIAGVIAHYWQGNVVLQAPECLGELIEHLSSVATRPIQGLLGLAAQVTRAREILGWTDAELQLDEKEGLYALPLDELIMPEDPRTGCVHGRRLERRDLDLAATWRLAYSLETLGAEETPELAERCRADMESSLERGDTWVLLTEEGGDPVASTSFNATIDEAVQVGGVWTPPEFRSRGYGRAVVAASLLGVRGEGVRRAILFTGDNNLPAIKAYAALGFRRIGDYRIILRR